MSPQQPGNLRLLTRGGRWVLRPHYGPRVWCPGLSVPRLVPRLQKPATSLPEPHLSSPPSFPVCQEDTRGSPWLSPLTPGRRRVVGDAGHADLGPWDRAHGALATGTRGPKAFPSEPGSEAGKGEVTLGSSGELGRGGPAYKIPGEAPHAPSSQGPVSSHAGGPGSLACQHRVIPPCQGLTPADPLPDHGRGPCGGGGAAQRGRSGPALFLGTCPFPEHPTHKPHPLSLPSGGASGHPKQLLVLPTPWDEQGGSSPRPLPHHPLAACGAGWPPATCMVLSLGHRPP